MLLVHISPLLLLTLSAHASTLLLPPLPLLRLLVHASTKRRTSCWGAV
jgi:hypothetical protein